MAWRVRFGLAAVLVVILAHAARSVCASAQSDASERADAAGKALVEQGRFDEAAAAYGDRISGMPWVLVEAARKAEYRGFRDEALGFYRAYFHYYPFGGPRWRQTSDELAGAARSYLELLGKTDPDKDDPLAAEDRQAGPLWQQMMALAHGSAVNEAQTQDRIFRLADEIIGRFPHSHLCAGAAMMAGWVASREPHPPGYSPNAMREVARLDSLLAKMKEAGAPVRTQVQVLLRVAYESYNGSDAELDRRSLRAWEDVYRLTEIPLEKKQALLWQGRVTFQIEDYDAARRHFREFLALYPDAPDTAAGASYPGVPHAAEACRGIVESLLAEHDTQAALDALREFQQGAQRDADLGWPMFEIAQALHSHGQKDKSLALVEELVERYPSSEVVGKAWLGLGEMYRDMGDEARMVAAYRRAAELPSVDAFSFTNASNTRNIAFESLAQYYTQKQQWAQALRWWWLWHPTSWCGTCAESMELRRAKALAQCATNLLGPLWIRTVAILLGTALILWGPLRSLVAKRWPRSASGTPSARKPQRIWRTAAAYLAVTVWTWYAAAATGLQWGWVVAAIVTLILARRLQVRVARRRSERLGVPVADQNMLPTAAWKAGAGIVGGAMILLGIFMY